MPAVVAEVVAVEAEILETFGEVGVLCVAVELAPHRKRLLDERRRVRIFALQGENIAEVGSVFAIAASGAASSRRRISSASRSCCSAAA